MYAALGIVVLLLVPLIASLRTRRGTIAGFVMFLMVSVLFLAQAVNCLLTDWPTAYWDVAALFDLNGVSTLMGLPVFLLVNLFIWLGPVASSAFWGIVGLTFLAWTWSGWWAAYVGAGEEEAREGAERGQGRPE